MGVYGRSGGRRGGQSQEQSRPRGVKDLKTEKLPTGRLACWSRKSLIEKTCIGIFHPKSSLFCLINPQAPGPGHPVSTPTESAALHVLTEGICFCRSQSPHFYVDLLNLELTFGAETQGVWGSCTPSSE